MTSAINVIPSWNLTLEQARTVIGNRGDLVQALAKRTTLPPSINAFDNGLLTKTLDLLHLDDLLSMLGTITTQFPVSCLLYRLAHTEHITCPHLFIREAENEIRFPPGKLLRVDV